MINLDFIYSAFGVALLLVIMVYYYSAVREKRNVSFVESKIWLFGSIGYILMLIYNGLNSSLSLYIFYFFLLSTEFLALYILNRGIKDKVIVPLNFYIGIMIFSIMWVLYSIIEGSSFYITILPSLLIQCCAYFFIGLMYLLHEDYEMSMRNISGMMFLMMTLTKLFYLVDLPIELEVYINYIFRVDFTLYLILCFVVVIFDYSREIMMTSGKNIQVSDFFESTPIGIVQLNSRGDFIAMNESVKKVLPHSEFSELPVNVHDLSKLHFDQEWQKILVQLNLGKSYSLEADIFLGEDEGRYEFLFLPNFSRLEEEQSLNVTCIILSCRRPYSIVSRVSIEDKGGLVIPNKYKLMELFDEGINVHKFNDFGVILVKILNYKTLLNIVNDHETTAIDELIVSKLNKLDFIYCFGKVEDDTFEIMTTNILEVDEIHKYVTYIKEVLTYQSFYDHEMNVYTLDFRLGISIAPIDGFTQRKLLRNASVAMTKAISLKKGSAVFYKSDIIEALDSREQLEIKLREAIFNDDLFIEYQPQYTINNKEIRGFEALVRWQFDDEVMKPDQFIPMAEEMGIMDELGEWVLRHSLIEATKWNIRYNKYWIISVNLSIKQLKNEGFADSVIRLLEEFDFSPEYLELEVTEMKLAKATDRVFIELRKLQSYGINIAVDDFGTGISSLDYLKQLPFSMLKIEKSFIEGLQDDQMDYKIIESVLDLISDMKLESMVKSVETREQLEFLRKTSCNFLQGYIYNPPLSKKDVVELIIKSM